MRNFRSVLVVCLLAGALGVAVPAATAAPRTQSAAVQAPTTSAGGRFECIEELRTACEVVAKVLCKNPCYLNTAATSPRIYCDRGIQLVCAVLAKTICKPGCAVATASGTRTPVPRMTCEPDAIEIVCFALGKTLCAKPGTCGLAVGLRTDSATKTLIAPRVYCGLGLDTVCHLVCPHCALTAAAVGRT